MQNASLLTETQLTMSGTGHLKVKYGARGSGDYQLRRSRRLRAH